MLIEFKLSGPGPFVVQVLLQMVIFMTKQKFLSRVLFTATILYEAM